MPTIKQYEVADHHEVLEFIRKATTATEINEEVIKNSILIKKNTSVIGMIAFEAFNHIGMIRYFLYDQLLMPDLLVNMFFELYAGAKKSGINQLIVMVNSPYAYQLFELLGFMEIKKSINFKELGITNSERTSLMSIKL